MVRCLGRRKISVVILSLTSNSINGCCLAQVLYSDPVLTNANQYCIMGWPAGPQALARLEQETRCDADPFPMATRASELMLILVYIYMYIHQ